MTLLYLDFSRDPRGMHPEHLRPSVAQDVSKFLYGIPNINPLQVDGVPADAFAVVRVPWPTAQTLTETKEWRDGLAERSLRVSAVEPVGEFA